jgi:hypothetical protein
MFALAGIYVLLQAEFIAAIQVLVYAGAVMVLFLFVIMLLNVEAAPREWKRWPLWLLASGLAAVLTAELLAQSENVTFDANPMTVVGLSLSEISSRVTDKTESRWQFAWKVTVRNLRDEAQEFAFSISWLDIDGFVVDTADEFNLQIAPRENRVFSGAELINLPAAMSVKAIQLDLIQVREVTP